MADRTLIDKVEKRFTEWDSLFDRMQTDADLFNLAKYTIKDTENHQIPHSLSVTINDAAVFAWRVETALNSAIEQIAVTSNNKRFDTAYVEDFLRNAFKAADKLLPLRDLYPLNPFLDQQTCRRGRVAARCLFQIIKGELNPDITPWDTKYCVYGMDKNGMAIAGYKTTRSKDQIIAEYPNADVPNGTDLTFYDIFTRERHELWVSDKNIYEERNKFGYVPVAYRKVPMGSMLLDSDTIKHQGESILFLIRDLLDELNRALSILQSLNQKSLDHALQLKIPLQGITPEMPVKGHDEVTKPGAVNVVPSEGGYEYMPIGEVINHVELLIAKIEERLQRGGLNAFEAGTFKQPMSAVALIQVAQGQDLIYLPRVATRGLLKQDLSEMLIKQVIASGESTVKLNNQEFEVAKLKGEYEIEFKYSFNDPKLDAARSSLAAAQRGLIPDRAIRRDTLQREDPEEDERWLAWEKAARVSPLVDLRRTILHLIEEADRGDEDARGEAEIMCDSQYLPMLEQAILGKELQGAGELKPAQPVVPLMGGTSQQQ